MQGFLTSLGDLFSIDQWIWLISGITVITFVFSLVWVVYMIRKIPADYFIHKDKKAFTQKPSMISWVLYGIRNVFGIILILLGIIMLFTPGQGLLTIVMGLSIMNFPGKRQLEIRLLRMKSISRSLNWIRQKKGLADIQIP